MYASKLNDQNNKSHRSTVKKKKTSLIILIVLNVIFDAEFKNHNKSSVSNTIFAQT